MCVTMFEITKLSKIPLCRILPIPTGNLCLHGVATAESKSSTCSPLACNALNLKVQSPSPVADKVLVGSKVTELKWEEMTVECYNGASGGSLFLGQAGSGGVSVGIANSLTALNVTLPLLPPSFPVLLSVLSPRNAKVPAYATS